MTPDTISDSIYANWREQQIVAFTTSSQTLKHTTKSADFDCSFPQNSQNRSALEKAIHRPIYWLKQCHSNRVIIAEEHEDALRGSTKKNSVEADGLICFSQKIACAVLTADCLPIVIACDRGFAIIHAGWRGLAKGIIANSIATLQAHQATPTQAWIAPSINPKNYEVDCTVHQHFTKHADCFNPTRPGHWIANLQAIAEQQLCALGIHAVFHANEHSDVHPHLYSYRHDNHTTKRQATVAFSL